jgi:hypothetical protein
MFRTLTCCFLAFLVGCQGVPVQLALPTRPKQEATIVLFEEIAPGREAVKEVVHRHLPAGTSVERAREMLEKQGFACREYTSWTWHFNQSELIPDGIHLSPTERHRLYEQRAQRPVFCNAILKASGEWHLASYQVLVVLVPDEAGAVQDMEVGINRQYHRNEEYFKERPGLHDPVGVPVEEARTRLVDAGFYCMGIGKKTEKDDRPYLLFVAFDEGLLWGQVIRVRLYPDDAGVVRKTEVATEPGKFDSEWCMLPHGDETPTWAVCKAALFPGRVACRWTLITGLVCVGLAVTCAAHPGVR